MRGWNLARLPMPFLTRGGVTGLLDKLQTWRKKNQKPPRSPMHLPCASMGGMSCTHLGLLLTLQSSQTPSLKHTVPPYRGQQPFLPAWPGEGAAGEGRGGDHHNGWLIKLKPELCRFWASRQALRSSGLPTDNRILATADLKLPIDSHQLQNQGKRHTRGFYSTIYRARSSMTPSP